MSVSSYEELRRRNIADNKRILAEIGLINPFKALPRVTLKKGGFKRKAESQLPRQHKRPLLEQNVDVSSHGSLLGARRRSARLQGSDTPTEAELKKQVEQWVEEEDDTPRKVAPNRPNIYGAIDNVDVGTVWLTRMECCRDGIHRPTVAGIHGGAEGAYSIALSGGYDDNIDLGDCFTYTGEGIPSDYIKQFGSRSGPTSGRDLKGTSSNPKNLRTAPQSKDQTLSRGNLALSKNVETGYPVRVIRGYKLNSLFAPEEGYRYDGLYSVQKAWFTTGLSGFKVWKFALKRCEGQAPPPWTFAEGLDKEDMKRKMNNNDVNETDLNQKKEDSEAETEKNTKIGSNEIHPEKPLIDNQVPDNKAIKSEDQSVSYEKMNINEQAEKENRSEDTNELPEREYRSEDESVSDEVNTNELPEKENRSEDESVSDEVNTNELSEKE